MTVSELIEDLQAALGEVGDVVVNGETMNVESVCVYPADENGPAFVQL